MRRGFGLIQALMLLLLLAGLMTVAIKYARIGVRHTTDSYVREQAELLLRSAIEKMLYEISKTDRSAGCYQAFDETVDAGHGKRYRVHVAVTRYYLADGSTCAPETVPVATEGSHGAVMLEAEVNASVDGETVVRVLRRSLQRP